MSTAYYEFTAETALDEVKELAKSIAPDADEATAIAKALQTAAGRALYKNYTDARAAIVRGDD